MMITTPTVSARELAKRLAVSSQFLTTHYLFTGRIPMIRRTEQNNALYHPETGKLLRPHLPTPLTPTELQQLYTDPNRHNYNVRAEIEAALADQMAPPLLQVFMETPILRPHLLTPQQLNPHSSLYLKTLFKKSLENTQLSEVMVDLGDYPALMEMGYEGYIAGVGYDPHDMRNYRFPSEKKARILMNDWLANRRSSPSDTDTTRTQTITDRRYYPADHPDPPATHARPLTLFQRERNAEERKQHKRKVQAATRRLNQEKVKSLLNPSTSDDL